MTVHEDFMPFLYMAKYMFMVVILIYCPSPLKNGLPENFTIANFRHQVSKSRLRPWSLPVLVRWSILVLIAFKSGVIHCIENNAYQGP